MTAASGLVLLATDEDIWLLKSSNQTKFRNIETYGPINTKFRSIYFTYLIHK
jgi:hypothetical protein